MLANVLSSPGMVMRNDDWNRYEDGQRAPGGMMSNWTSEEHFTWHLEVREWLDE